MLNSLLELTEISDEWQPTTLGQLANIRRGASPRPIQDPKWFSNDGPGWVRIIDVTRSNKYLKTTEQRLSSLGVKKSVSIHPGDLIMSICGTIGIPVISEIEACIHDGFVLFDKLSEEVDSLFLLYLLTRETQIFDSKGQPGTQKNINTSIVKSTSILLPPLAEQKKIAEILSSLDETIVYTQSVIDQIQVIKRSLMQQLLTKGLPGWHSDYKRVGNVEIPDSWDVVSLEHCAVVQTGIAKGRRYAEGQEFVDVPYLRVANVQDGYFDLSEIKTIQILPEEIDRYLLKKGDVLLTEGGDADKLGRGHIWQSEINECVHQNHIFCVRPDPQILHPHFLNYLASSTYGKTYFLNSSKQTTNLASINSTQLKQFPCLLPSLAEQTKIVRTLDTVEQRLQTERRRKRQLEAVKKGLMQQLLTGKLRVPIAVTEPIGGE